jgi:hypothetical protein
MHRRQPAELVAWDPVVERAAVLVRTGSGVLATSFVAAVGLTLVGTAQTPVGWFVVGVAAVVGGVPAVVAHLHHSRSQERLPIGDLPPAAAGLVAQAVAHSERLRVLAAASPEGPVADHFHELATTAERYVVALHSALRQSSVDSAHLDVRYDVERLVAQLAELTEAASELRQAQRRRLEPSPLEALTEKTRRLTEAIDSTQHWDRLL